MSQTTEQYFEEHQQEDGTLPPEAMAALLTGDDTNGDTLNTIEEDGKQPEPVATDDVDDADKEKVDDPPVDPEQATDDDPPAEPEEKPVIMAKDGVHTIEYEKLEEAREKAKLYKEKSESQDEKINSLQETVDALTAAKEDPTDDGAAQEAIEALKDLQDNDPEVYKAVQAMLEAKDKTFDDKLTDLEDRLAKALEPIQESAEDNAVDSHFNDIFEAHNDHEELLVEDGPVDQWIAKQPSFMQTSMNAVMENGGTQDVIDLVTQYKDANPVETPPEKASDSDAKEIADKAAEAVKAAKEKTTVPNSLSEVPAGTKAHHDENEALLNMNGQKQIQKFANMSSNDILENLSRVL